MRLHSNSLTIPQFRTALSDEQTTGRVAPSVYFHTLTEHKSQSRARAFEVRLMAGDDGAPGRRVASWGGEGHSATHDEWGFVMAALYRIDPSAVWGSVKHPQYADADHFHHVTGLTYNPDELLPLLDSDATSPFYGHHDFISSDPYPYQHRAQVGRYGAGRKPEDDAYPGYDVYRPRTAEWVRQFAHLTNEPAHV